MKINKCHLHLAGEHPKYIPDNTHCCSFCSRPTTRKKKLFGHWYHETCEREDYKLYKEIQAEKQ